jgi:hypothetical protein
MLDDGPLTEDGPKLFDPFRSSLSWQPLDDRSQMPYPGIPIVRPPRSS